jgi:molecular chaperone GrpE
MSTNTSNPGGDPEQDPTSSVISEAEAVLAEAAETIAEEQAGSPAGEPAEDADEDPAVVKAQRDEYLDSLRRLQADFDNYRKRVQKDTEMAADRAAEKLVNAMVPVLDTFELALSHEADPDASPLAKLHDQLLTALEGQGLERLHPLDQAFDPNDAEAVMTEPADEGQHTPVVSQVLRAGYRWRGRVMRAAMVKVKG